MPAPPDSATVDRSIFRHLRGRVPPEILEGTARAGAAAPDTGATTDSTGIGEKRPAGSPVGDGPRLATPDDSVSTHAVPDSIGAPAESDSLGGRAPGAADVGSREDPARAAERAGSLFRIRRAVLDRTPDRTTTEILPWIVPLTSVPSGSPFVPDPLDPGDLPGREPPLVLLEGLPVSPPGWPESSPLVVDPVWLESIRFSRRDPVRLPNDPNGGIAMELDVIRPDSLAVISGARLSDGSTDANTDALYFVRPSARSMTHVFWADHKAQGRLEYGSEDGGNVVVRHERNLGGGTAALSYQEGFARVRVFLPGDVFLPGARWLWDRSGFVGSWAATAGVWAWSLRGERTWHRLGWEGSDHPATRKSAVSRALFTAARSGAALTPRLTIQLDAERLRYYAPGRLSFDDTRTGLGFAGGLEGVSKGWRFAVSAGRAEPLPGQSGIAGALHIERRLGTRFLMQAGASRGVRPRLLPRSANDLEIAVGQALTFPVFDPAPKLETLAEASLRLVRASGVSRDDGSQSLKDAGTPHEAVEIRVLEIDHAVLPDSGASAFDPSGFLRQDLNPRELDRKLRVVSFRGDWVRRLPLGFSLDGWFAVRTADPGWKEQLWMTPAEARGRLAWSRRWFDNLDLEFFVRGEWSASRAGRGGTIAPMNRFDGGAQATVGAWSAYLAWINLENDVRESATWTTAAMPLPLRSFRMGMVWRFLD